MEKAVYISATLTAISFVIFVFFVISTIAFIKIRRDKFKKIDIDYLDKEGLEKAEKNYLKLVNKQPGNVDAIEKLKSIYEKLGEKEKAKELYDQLLKISGEKEYENNLSKKITLSQLELQDLYFFADLEWIFQPRMNVLLGKNGFGKSYLLRLLVFLLQKNDDVSGDFFKYSRNNPHAELKLDRDNKSESIIRGKILFEESIGKVPVLAIPAMRFVDKSKSEFGPAEEDEADLKHHGAYHFLYQKSLDELVKNFIYQLCINYLDAGKSFDLPIFRLLHKVIGELSEDGFKFHKIEPIGRARFKIDVLTEGNDKALPLQQASQGTLSVLAIFGLIYEYLKALYPRFDGDELLKQPAIVVIDELDAHLHPAWQQKIIRLLRENFPNVQFFAAAHSPLVVAGCKEGEVAVLRKEEKGFGVQVFDHDFIGYETKKLYGQVFEIEEKDELYLKYLAMSFFKNEIEEKIKYLEAKQRKKALSKKEESELEQLYDDNYYVEKAEALYHKQMEKTNLLLENRKLKKKIRDLENGGQKGTRDIK
ncbi:MAG: AAA family ATPase [Candidatus Aminicenantes bacterium]|nr:AAA family ATPase [Candidatus Aminicenantes bacterium]